MENQKMEEETTFRIEIVTPVGKKIVIPKGIFSGRDQVLFLRDMLSEYQDVCHHTNYQFEAVDAKKKHVTVLNDFMDFAEYPDVISGKSHLRMKLLPYTLATCHEHVRVIRNIIVDPPVSIPTVSKKEVSSSDGKTTKKNEADPQMSQKQEKQQKETQDKTTQDKQIHSKDKVEQQQEEEEKKEEDENSTKQEEDKTVVTNPKAQTHPVLQDMVDKSLAQMEKLTESNIREAKTQFPDLQVPIDSDVSLIRVAPRILQRQNVNEKSKFKNKIPGLQFSGWNPPPPQRKFLGDLCYLEVHTPEGSVVNVTATPDGFFVNASRDGHFNPAPAYESYFNHSLLKVLQRLSPVFAKYYSRQLQIGVKKESDVENEDLTYLSVPWQASRVPKEPELDRASSWLQKQIEHHSYDLNRSEEALCELRSAGVTNLSAKSRDWNDEYQSCRQLPRSTGEENMIRARALLRIQLDFKKAATDGARAVVERRVIPMNIQDEPSSHVYVHNNIFFSLALDSRGLYKDNGGDETSRKLALLDLQGVRALNRVDLDGLNTVLTAVVDYMGQRVIAQSLIPGILHGEVASSLLYGSVDHGSTLCWREDMHALVKTAFSRLGCKEVPMCSKEEEKAEEKEEEKEEDKEEEEKKVQEEKNESKVPAGKTVQVSGPAEMKGILGSDNRKYVLDIVRHTSPDLNFEKQEGAHLTCVLRPELKVSYIRYHLGVIQQCKARIAILNLRKKQMENEKKKDEEEGDKKKEGESDKSKKEEGEKKDVAEEIEKSIEILTNKVINSTTAVKLANSLNLNLKTEYGKVGEYKNKKERDIDLSFAQTLSKYLTESVIPSLMLDLQKRALSCIDGEALTRSFHMSGVNMRYLGVVADILAKREKDPRTGPNFVLEACEMEMVARVASRVFGDYLRKYDELRAAPVIFTSTFLNALMSPSDGGDSDNNNNKKKKNDGNKKKSPKNSKKDEKFVSPTTVAADEIMQKLDLNSETLWSKLRAEVSRKYKYDLTIWGSIDEEKKKQETKNASEAKNTKLDKKRRSLISLLRRVCLRCGIVLKQKDYRKATIALDDIVNIIPVARSSVPIVPLQPARQILDRVNMLLNQKNGAKNIPIAFTNTHRALAMLYSVCGASHVETVRCKEILADITYRVGNKGSLVHQRHIVEILERLRGVSHFETIQARVKLAMMMFTLDEKKQGIELLLQCVRTMDIISGIGNPETSSLYLKLGKMYRIVFQPTMAHRCFSEALRRAIYDRNIQIEAHRELALLNSDTGHHSQALKIQKRAYELCNFYYGPKHAITEQSKAFYKAMTQRLVDARALK